jgi:hypothetical protein
MDAHSLMVYIGFFSAMAVVISHLELRVAEISESEYLCLKPRVVTGVLSLAL